MKDALLIVALESIIFASLLTSVKNKKYLISAVVFVFLICFFIFVNTDDARKILSRDVKDSSTFAWLAASTTFVFAAVQVFSTENNVTLTIKKWNKTTNNLLFFGLLLSVLSILKT